MDISSQSAEMEHKRTSEISSGPSSADNPSLQLNVDRSFGRARPKYLDFDVQGENPWPWNCLSNQIIKNDDVNLDAKTVLNNLSFLEQKIHNIQGIIRSIVSQKSHMSVRLNEFSIQQQLVATDLTSVIVELISTAGNLLPSIKNNCLSSDLPPKQSFCKSLEADAPWLKSEQAPLEMEKGVKDCNELMESLDDCVEELNEPFEHDLKEIEEGVKTDSFPPGSYEVLQLEKEEILAPHTHFCTICGKGFKRDANLRMHMRGHGNEYKTPAALAKPNKDLEPALIKRYSCPLVGCKRNKEHKNFQPLKTLLCIKNHYKRSHCEKSYICSACHTKKFSVLADLKTHEKHCGRDKWLCSCGTTFSRKDKLFGHVALFQGHAPALPAYDSAFGSESSEHRNGNEVGLGIPGDGYGFSSNSANDAKLFDDDRCYLSTLSFEPYDCGASDEFMKTAFDLMENSLNNYPL